MPPAPMMATHSRKYRTVPTRASQLPVPEAGAVDRQICLDVDVVIVIGVPPSIGALTDHRRLRARKGSATRRQLAWPGPARAGLAGVAQLVERLTCNEDV